MANMLVPGGLPQEPAPSKEPAGKNGPAWGYRANPDSGEAESRLFSDGVFPSGWTDSPANVVVSHRPIDDISELSDQPADAHDVSDAPKRRGRPPGSKNKVVTDDGNV